jgi:hypothetical protein
MFADSDLGSGAVISPTLLNTMVQQYGPGGFCERIAAVCDVELDKLPSCFDV